MIIGLGYFCSTKGICFQNIGTGLQIGKMNSFNYMRLGKNEDFIITLNIISMICKSGTPIIFLR